MKHRAIFAIVAFWLASSMVVANPKSWHGGYRAFLDHIKDIEMIKAEAGDPLQQAIKAIPIETDTPITSEQEADLHDWLYDFLTAFSVSGSDSLAAAFYLRDGVDPGFNFSKIKIKIQDQFDLSEDQLERAKPREEDFPPITAPAFEHLKIGHKIIQRATNYDYFFGNVSFFASEYSVFKLQGEYYDSYRDWARENELIPLRLTEWFPKLRGEIEEGLKAGGQWTSAQFMFVVEEPEFADYEYLARYSFFVRLVWSRAGRTWRLIEAFVPHDAPVVFLFDSL